MGGCWERQGTAPVLQELVIHSKEWANLEDERTKAAGLLMVGGLLEGSLEEVAFRCRVESRVLWNSFSQGLRELGERLSG